MHIQHIEIGNFRKLRAVRVDFAENTTVFVGANNSGKTSAMVALRRFLVDKSDFSIYDLTLTHWPVLDQIGVSWDQLKDGETGEPFDWGTVTPFVDVWLKVSADELHYVQKLLPTLDWNDSLIGVRIRLQPKDADALQREYVTARADAAAVMSGENTEASSTNNAQKPGDQAKGTKPFSLWPHSMMDFLARRFGSTFELCAYLLDPEKLALPQNGLASPQALPAGSEAIEGNPFEGLIQIDEISAQRGFGFPSQARSHQDDDGGDRNDHRGGKKLSSQLRTYYTKHLDPFEKPEPKDLQALRALHEAQEAFGERLSACFSASFEELQGIGYPGVTDPKLTITTSIKPIDGLNHASAVQYEVPGAFGAPAIHRLPEDSNGLGYQNLVSMVFALMSFRDRWMKEGKASKTAASNKSTPRLHLVLIEEPEAHLHAQVQQVFINQAYEILRKHDKLKGSNELRTQMIVSTHSTHVAHEADFASLRYFRRLPATSEPGAVPVSSVVNLSEVFGNENQTERFVKRYLKATHCDLFFADGAILVEGPAERILIPHLVRRRADYDYLKRSYITWLEIGGSHAHRMRRLIEHLGLNTLIITDIDAKDGTTNKTVIPKRAAGHLTRNATVSGWIPAREAYDDLIDLDAIELVAAHDSGYAVRVAYQRPVKVKLDDKAASFDEALPNTFEDALVYENIPLFKTLKGTKLIGAFRRALQECKTLDEIAERFHAALQGDAAKAQFALDLLYTDEIDVIKVPGYIHEGLTWLAGRLKRQEAELDGKPLAEAA